MLPSRLRTALRAPRFEDGRKDASASLVNTVLWVTIIGSATYEVFQLAVGTDPLRVVGVAIGITLALVGLAALRHRRLGLAAWLACSMLFGTACMSIWLAGRIDAPGTATLLILIIMSSMALDWRSAVTWTLLSIGVLALFTVAEVRGWTPAAAVQRPASELWFLYSLHLAAAGWLVAHSAFAFRGVLGLLGQRSSALRYSEARHAQLIEQSPDVIVALDGAGVVSECSPAVERLLGYEAHEVVGRTFPDLGVLDGEEAVAVYSAAFESILANETDELGEVRLRHRDGSYRWAEVNARVVRPADGGIRMYVVIRDATARHEAEEQRALLERQLIEARRLEALGRMAGGVAHDFNNLLLVILANAELLKTGSTVATANLVDEIRVAAEGATDLTGQLLAFAGRQVPDVDRVDVAATVAKIDGLLRRLLPPNVQLEVHFPGELDPARGDAAQLEQVVVNLVMNAHQAMPEGGVVTLEMSNAQVAEVDRRLHPGASLGPHVRLAVTDRGRGMDDETLQRVFEPFFSQRAGGTGLGLATVHGTVARVGGHVRVRSELGRGTTFEVFLPVATGEAPVQGGAAPTRPAEASDDVVVLLVDDDASVLSAVSRLLERDGIRVLSVDLPEKAVAIGREPNTRIDLLVTDVWMPGQSGTKLARQLVEERPDLKVLFMSGYAPQDLSLDDMLNEGMNFIPKPFSSTTLQDRIREILREG